MWRETILFEGRFFKRRRLLRVPVPLGGNCFKIAYLIFGGESGSGYAVRSGFGNAQI